jgi:hypothetical protein
MHRSKMNCVPNTEFHLLVIPAQAGICHLYINMRCWSKGEPFPCENNHPEEANPDGLRAGRWFSGSVVVASTALSNRMRRMIPWSAYQKIISALKRHLFP